MLDHLQEKLWDSTQPPSDLPISATSRYFHLLSSQSAVEGMPSCSCLRPYSSVEHVTPCHPRIPTSILRQFSIVACPITEHRTTERRCPVPYYTGKGNHISIAPMDPAEPGLCLLKVVMQLPLPNSSLILLVPICVVWHLPKET